MRRIAFILIVTLSLAACGGGGGGEATQEGEPATTTAEAAASATSVVAEAASATSDAGSPAPSAATATNVPASSSGEIVQPYDSTGMLLLAYLNQWRLLYGLWPVKPNNTLNEVAQAQADYLATLATLPDDFHADAQGAHPPERAAAAGWPSYQNAAQIAVGEIAYVGAGPDAAVAWWQNSQIHADTVQSNVYREVGIGIAQHALGTVYVVDFGARPGVLPVLVDPVGGRMYLSSERSAYTIGGEWIREVTRYQLLPTPNSAIDANAWEPYTLTVLVPESLTGTFGVALDDGNVQMTTTVDPTVDIVWLEGNLTLGTTSSGTVSIPTNEPTTAAQPTAAATSAATSAPTSSGPTATSAPGGSIRIVYDDTMLAVVNTSGDPVNLDGLTMQSGAFSINADQWLVATPDVPLTAFPAGECLQAYSFNETSPTDPAGCSNIRSILTVAPERTFWARLDFTVSVDGTTLATCTVGGGQCDVTLP